MARSKEPRYKVWEIQTQLYDTYGNPYVDLSVLKARLDELHTPGVNDDGKEIPAELVDYAYVVHDRCRYTVEDEEEAAAAIANGSKRKPIKAGDPKPEHVHVELRKRNGCTLTALCKWLSDANIQIPEQWVVYVHENKDGELETFDDKCAYLCHLREPEKTPYRFDEIICTFNYEQMFTRYSQRKAKKGKSKASRAFQNEHIDAIAAGEETVSGFIKQFGYSAYEAAKAKYDHAEQFYLKTKYPGAGFRLTYLLTGPSTTGKTPLAKILACSLFPDETNPRDVFFSVGDAGAALQSYNGQPVIIWDDWRALDFILHFKRDVLFNSLFAVHPDPTDYNIKYGQTVLRHTVNIITCVDSLDTFARELAGEYTDRQGVFHKGEEAQILQAYKRIWGWSEVSEEDITVLFNKGYYNPACIDYYRQYEEAVRIKNSTRAIVERYAPKLYGQIGHKLLPEVKEKYDEYIERESQKVDDPSLIDWNAILELRGEVPAASDDEGEQMVLEMPIEPSRSFNRADLESWHDEKESEHQQILRYADESALEQELEKKEKIERRQAAEISDLVDRWYEETGASTFDPGAFSRWAVGRGRYGSCPYSPWSIGCGWACKTCGSTAQQCYNQRL